MKAKKSLGQNFLKSEVALKKIVEAGEIKPGDIILEIGPGKGALTERLLENAGSVFAVEKDRELVELLRTKFDKEIREGKLTLLEDDILKFDIKKYTPKSSYKIIANIPYNITGAILKKFLTEKHQPERMILMVQHEVAKRIVASDKKESILSISVKAYGEPKTIMKVPARYFSPAPKVDSAIIGIKNISRIFFEQNNINEEKFWEIVKTGFAHKRKKLSGNLKDTLLSKKEFWDSFGNKRAEDLQLQDWGLLAK
jgi:16S rRNA (adenine1518-N6/adenine1519-N6)-dimethyltransferase